MDKNKEKLNEELINAIGEIRKISMTSGEKERVLQNILSSPRNQPIKSPYTVYSFISIFNRKSFTYSLSVFCLVVILSSGTVFASTGSLPGNILYPLKVKVVEPVRGALIFSSEAKIQYESNLATERMIEAEILADEGRLDTSKEEELNSLLEIHTAAFHKAVINLRQNENIDKDKNDDIITDFEATMNAHARILNIVSGRQDDMGESTDTIISKTAKNNAIKVRENFRNKEEKQPQDQVENKEQNQDEDINNAHEKLLDSKSSAKEADIFLQAESNLKGEIR
jgi:hypothetical protein